MALWTKNADDDAVQRAEKPKSGSMLEKMVIDFVTSNPEIKASIEGFQTAVVSFAEQGKRIEALLMEIKDRQERIDLQLGMLAAQAKRPAVDFTGKGVVSDGTRCPACGTDGECSCFSD